MNFTSARILMREAGSGVRVGCAQIGVDAEVGHQVTSRCCCVAKYVVPRAESRGDVGRVEPCLGSVVAGHQARRLA